LLELKGVLVKYGGAEALKGISLKVKEGSIVVLIGANGAGKSTALRAISGLRRISSGEIWFLGKRIDGSNSNRIVREGITLVPEGRRIFPYMTVLENLVMGAYSRKDRSGIKRDLEEILEMFPALREKIRQPGGKLSGGQQQMLAIGRGLMAKPKLLLMDEPTIGLSPLIVNEILNIIKNINQMNVSVLLVEQNAQMALAVAHEGYVLEVGKITLGGPSKDLVNNKYVKEAYLGG